MANVVVESRQVEIQLADPLLLFTDRFSEAFNKRDEGYGEQRLAESFVCVRTLPPAIRVERLIADVVCLLRLGTTGRRHDADARRATTTSLGTCRGHGVLRQEPDGKPQLQLSVDSCLLSLDSSAREERATRTHG